MASGFCDPLMPCDNCGDVTEDTTRCSVQDNKNLCQDCFYALPQAKREDIGDSEWVCDNPCNQKVEFFCKTCQLGCCKECAGDIHEGHDVGYMPKLAEEIRCDLTQQFHGVTEKQEELLQLRKKFLDCVEKKNTAFGEAGAVVIKTVNEIKKKIEENLEEEVDFIAVHTEEKIRKLEENILELRAKRDMKIKQLVNSALDDISRIDRIYRDTGTLLLKDEESRDHVISTIKSTLLDDSEACDSAKKEITYFLDSTPENLVLHGGPFRSLVKTSLLHVFQSQGVVTKYCKEIVDDLPKVNVRDQPGDFIKSRSLPTSLMWVFSIMLILVAAFNARSTVHDHFNVLLGSDSLWDMGFKLSNMSILFISKCILLTVLQTSDLSCLCDSPFEFRLPFWKGFKLLMKLCCFAVYSELLIISLLILLYLLCNFFQMEEISENTVSFFSLLHSYCFIKFVITLETFKQSWNDMVPVFVHVVKVTAKFYLVCMFLMIFSRVLKEEWDYQ